MCSPSRGARPWITPGDADSTAGNPASGLAIDPLNFSEFPGIQHGEEKPLHVTGKATDAGEYQLVVTGWKRSGFFRDRLPLVLQRRIKVWKEIAFGRSV